MGGRSSSSSDQQQETVQLTSDGVVAGDLFQGKSVSVTQEFPDTVAQAFEQLIGLAGDTVQLAGQAGARALDNSQDAIAQVSDRTSFSENPNAQTINRYLPVFMLLTLGVSVYLIVRKGK